MDIWFRFRLPSLFGSLLVFVERLHGGRHASPPPPSARESSFPVAAHLGNFSTSRFSYSFSRLVFFRSSSGGALDLLHMRFEQMANVATDCSPFRAAPLGSQFSIVILLSSSSARHSISMAMAMANLQAAGRFSATAIPPPVILELSLRFCVDPVQPTTLVRLRSPRSTSKPLPLRNIRV